MKLRWFPACRRVLGYIVLLDCFKVFQSKTFAQPHAQLHQVPLFPGLFIGRMIQGLEAANLTFQVALTGGINTAQTALTFKRSLTYVDVNVERQYRERCKEKWKWREMHRKHQRAYGNHTPLPFQDVPALERFCHQPKFQVSPTPE